MKREKSTHAAAAAMIRAELKRHGIPASVKSDSYSGGNSVRVYITDPAPWTRKAIESFADQFQYGHFDGMTDSYEYSNRRKDLPQVRFVFVEVTYTDALWQRAYTFMRGIMSQWGELPESFPDARNMPSPLGPLNYRIYEQVYRVLNGSWDEMARGSQTPKFWKKPNIRLQAETRAAA